MRRGDSHVRRATWPIALALLTLMIGSGRTSRAQIVEERLPAANPPAATPSAGAATTAANAAASGEDASGDWQRVTAIVASPAARELKPSAPAPPAPARAAQVAAEPVPPAPDTIPAAAATAASAEDAAATPAAVASAPPPALDLSATNIGPDLSAVSLEPELKQAATPARAAALRLTEQARRELLAGGANRALQDLGRAVSIDPGNPFEYYYLGRVYLMRHNYAQAATFFHRAELGFAGRADWLSETLSFKGASDEQLGRTADAVAAYKRAIALAPGNVRAQVGLGRLAPSVAATELDQTAPADQSAAPPPAMPTPPPPPDEPPAPPPTSIRN